MDQVFQKNLSRHANSFHIPAMSPNGRCNVDPIYVLRNINESPAAGVTASLLSPTARRD
jgi:hypothetical protein